MNTLPKPTIRRLVQLAALLSQYKEQKITSKEIQSLTGWTDSVIRRDFFLMGFKGGVSNGYNVDELYSAIRSKLNISENSTINKNCCIVGLSRLGVALLENSIFENSPFTLVAGFDSNVNRTEILRSTFPLFPTSKLETVIKEKNIQFAILSVCDKDAQKMAEKLCICGISGIVNYTSTVLSLPSNIAIENVSPITALTNLAASAQDKNKRG